MQKTIRFNENQLLYLAAKAKRENTIAGNLHKKSSDTGKWQQRYFILYQNLLFYFENESSARPSGVALLEGSYCDRVVTPAALKSGKDTEKQYCFTITYKSEGQRQYDLRTETESECNAWIDHVKRAPYSKVLEQKEELEQKHLHLLQILDSERQAKWHYVQQTEELATDVKKLRGEVMLNKYKKDRITTVDSQEEETDELKKIKKVQSFFRGWLCRRRWKQIVELYIRSPHAESMRKRNSIVFNMVECEEEYNRQLSTLVTCFLRPLRMAASSKKPPITHEDVNSIFLNSETLLFLHQIFLKGLCARLENWPTLVLGDLFDMLLPMLCIYQEYVRNHHYSLQVLAEYKQKLEFNSLLKRYEEKPLCEGRTLEIFLTYPMHQIPRYIITLHELLAHTPHDHVERQSLEYAKSKLEELSRIMHDEVSETENIRKNLSIERMIVEGCDILLDVNQTFVRQGTLLQVFHEKGKSVRGRLGSFSSTFKESKKEVVRQIFLFTNHMLLTTRASNGRLHLAKILPKDRQHYGKIPLIDCTLIEDPNTEICFFDEETESLDNFSLLTNASGATLLPTQTYDSRDGTRPDYNGLDFKIIVDSKSGPPTVLTLVASTYQEKIAWCSDISQCIENLHYSDLLNTSMSESSSVTMPQSVRSDPKLFRDDVDIKFSRTLNSCKVPQIRHASVERLLDRLTDLRFLSIDFLNTFLLTYRVFTNGKTVLDALKRVYKNPECGNLETAQASGQSSSDMDIYGSSPPQFTEEPPSHSRLMIKPQAEKPRRISTGMMNLETTGTSKPAIQIISKEAPPTALRKTLLDDGSEKPQTRRVSFHKLERTESLEATPEVADTEDSRTLEMDTYLSPPGLAPIASQETLYDELTIPDLPSFTQDHPMHSPSGISLPIPTESSTDDFDSEYRTLKLVHEEDTISIPGMEKELEPPTLSPRPFGMYAFGSAASSETLTPGTPRVSPMPSPHISTRMIKSYYANGSPRSTSPRQLSSPSKNLLFNGGSESKMFEALALSPTSSPIRTRPIAIRVPSPRSASPSRQPLSPSRQPPSPIYGLQQPPSPLRRPSSPCRSPSSSPKFRRAHSPMSPSMSSPNILTPHTGIKMRQDISGKRGSASAEAESVVSSPRSSIVTQIEGSPPTSRVGAVVTSSRRSTRRSSSSSAMIAFAAATAGSADPLTSSQQTQTVPVVQPQVSVSAPQPESQQKQQQEQPAQPPHQPPKRYLSTGAVVITDPKLLKKRESVISTAATMRVLNIIKHWVSKHQQDFETDQELKTNVIDMLEEMVCNTSLVPAEHKVAASILRTITKESEDSKRVDLNKLLTPPEVSSMDNFDTLSALDIAEQLTYLDHKIFISIRSEELLGQAWMKPDKSHKAPHVLLVSKRFNEVSRLVVSEIVSRQNLQDRVACIEKWAAIADICRCMHNYNGVLQICAAFVNSSVYRLKKTWEKLSKQTKNMIEKLQVLVSSDGRFKNMRDALHRYGCDPPCIPYLGMYLTDLSFIEEGTPDFTDEGLVNFSKMRMIAHVIREIRLFQQTPYRIEHHCRTSNYLLDTRRLLDDDQTYKASLEIEPKQSRLSTVSLVPS